MNLTIEEIDSWPWSYKNNKGKKKSRNYTWEYYVYAFRADRFTLFVHYSVETDEITHVGWAEHCRPKGASGQSNVPCSVEKVLSYDKINPELKQKLLYHLDIFGK